MKIIRFCPAKINLFLEVTGKLPNGYHELATLFAKINLGDTLTLNAEPSPKTEISLTMTGPVSQQLSSGPDNLVWKAAQAFLDFFQFTAKIDIVLDKHIPTGAGLGGGSSDAANVLVGLCNIFQKDVHLLIPTATKLGADVPLFLFEDTFLKGAGVGDKLTPVASSGPLPWIVLVYPNTPVSTQGVFKRLQLPPYEKTLTNLSKLDKLLEDVRYGLPFSQWKGLFFNRLEECVFPYEPIVRTTWEDLKSQADVVLMSGSGSTVFCLLETEKIAKEVVAKIQNKERMCFITTFYTDKKNEDHRNPHTSYGRGTLKSVR